GDQPETIKQRITELYGLLSQTIDEQITGQAPRRANGQVTTAQQPRALPAPSQQRQPTQQRVYNVQNRIAGKVNNGTNENGSNGTPPRRVNATEAQCRAIMQFAACMGLFLPRPATRRSHMPTKLLNLISARRRDKMFSEIRHLVNEVDAQDRSLE